MQVVLTASSAESARLVAQEILDALASKPDLVLGLATGSTPVPVYARLREAAARGEADFSRVTTFNLDEYIGLPVEHPRSYHSFMREHLFEGLRVAADRTAFPPTAGADLPARCAEFEERIRACGGIDLQLLGLGRNGHIGFNEPGSPLDSRTRTVQLCERTLEDNARFFESGEDQPRRAVTMGIATILDARRILLQAAGPAKAHAVRSAVEGPVTETLPASALRRHADTTFYLDPGAARDLTPSERVPAH